MKSKNSSNAGEECSRTKTINILQGKASKDPLLTVIVHVLFSTLSSSAEHDADLIPSIDGLLIHFHEQLLYSRRLQGRPHTAEADPWTDLKSCHLWLKETIVFTVPFP